MWTEDWAFNNGAGISEQGVSLLTHLGAAGVRDYSALSQPSSPNVMYGKCSRSLRVFFPQPQRSGAQAVNPTFCKANQAQIASCDMGLCAHSTVAPATFQRGR